MNKKLLFGAVLAAGLTACSDEALELETAASKPAEAKALTGVTFDITKSGNDAETRATWNANDRTISFEKSDLVSLYWIGNDGLEAPSMNFKVDAATLKPSMSTLAGALNGQTNAIFRTTDGKSFSAEAVVFEGYNLLVYPANTTHVTSKLVEVSIPQNQDAKTDYLKNVVYVSDSLLQIHAPHQAADGKLYNMYAQQGTATDANTSGYSHNIKTSVKMLSSILDLNFKIENATPSQNVQIQKVTLVAEYLGSPVNAFVTKGNIDPGTANLHPSIYNRAMHVNPWIASTTKVSSVSTEYISGTSAKLVLLPVDTSVADKYYLDVTTNYGVVRVGFNVNPGDGQMQMIMNKNGYDYAATDDQTALANIMKATSTTVTKKFKEGNPAVDKQYDYTTGAYIPRVVKVDMTKAKVDGMHVKSTAELNTVLSSVRNETNITLYLDHTDGKFELTDFNVNNFSKTLTLAAGNDLNPGNGVAPLTTIVVNTTSETALQNIKGLPAALNLEIPATSAINTIKAAPAPAPATVIANPIVNQKTISAPANSTITLADNSKGTINWNNGSVINAGTGFDATKYGTIASVATNEANLTAALNAGANNITVNNLQSGFFTNPINAATTNALVSGTPVKLIMNNCGDLSATVPGGITSNDLVLSGNTSYSNMASGNVSLVEIMAGTSTIGNSNTLAYIAVHGGATANINKITTTSYTLSVSGTATLNNECVAPTNLYALGTVDYKGKKNADINNVNGQTYKNVVANPAIGTMAVITGTLKTANDLAYATVKVSGTTKITGKVAYTSKVYVVVNSQAQGTANLYWTAAAASTEPTSWDGIKF